uniref:Uncharacterized protein n=1 Tax=Glossina morsitans morsitans TaxID=37546 RepID=A0A1B0G040_GLOMM
MKFIIVFAALFAAALAAPQHYEHHEHHDHYDHAEVLRYESDVRPDGYKFGFETSDGTQHDAEGQLKNLDKDHDALVVHGSFSFVDKEGHKYQVDYVADEYGYQPKGAHLHHP